MVTAMTAVAEASGDTLDEWLRQYHGEINNMF
jgi:hypothetical protein